MLREYDLLGPLEGVSGLVIGVDKGVDLIAHLAWRSETRAGQSFGGENGEPDLDLIEPGGMGRRKMEMDVLVPRQPAVVFGLVGTLLHGSAARAKSAPGIDFSCKANVFRSPKLQHSVQRRDSNGHLGRLPPLGP
jgi:hypothetical protein